MKISVHAPYDVPKKVLRSLSKFRLIVSEGRVNLEDLRSGFLLSKVQIACS